MTSGRHLSDRFFFDGDHKLRRKRSLIRDCCSRRGTSGSFSLMAPRLRLLSLRRSTQTLTGIGCGATIGLRTGS